MNVPPKVGQASCLSAAAWFQGSEAYRRRPACPGDQE